ncbi:DUF6252 family protein [Hymenobacter chitinivorans]|uniref:Lipoprotein n=1 Tax=Hymenobacter chitinivorans DSM 11115 TaxID=1121954 RepID=A0A2M9BQA1_9BACT|nr:DUF6252 family protein [Hymenobacter chitinivorans]PJJ60133.1 hypothetical protein CLV45_1558 [Hymenobacter chitinivorans DSM 11115]
MIKVFTKSHGVASCWIALALLAGSGCKKVEEIVAPKLPDATQDGKNTFGCMLDDKVWVPYTDHVLDDKMDANYSSTSFRVSAEQYDDGTDHTQFDLYVTAANVQPGTYAVGQGFSAQFERQKKGGGSIDTYSTSTGSLTITKVEARTSTFNNVTSRYTVVAGTFSFTAAAPGGQTVVVKDGRFDAQAF